MRTIASLRPFPMRVGNFVGNTIEKAAVLPISIPPRKKYLVYSLFTQGEAAASCGHRKEFLFRVALAPAMGNASSVFLAGFLRKSVHVMDNILANSLKILRNLSV